MDATARQIASAGAAAVALSDIARAAGVSKALIHYHFADKETLLARLVDHLADGVVSRERAALAPYEHRHDPLAVDALWMCLERELQRGDLCVLLELDAYRGAHVRQAARAAAARRQASAENTVRQLFAILDLRPRIDASLLGSVLLAFVDGIAIRHGRDARDDAAPAPRVAFDVFWLAMLSLAE